LGFLQFDLSFLRPGVDGLAGELGDVSGRRLFRGGGTQTGSCMSKLDNIDRLKAAVESDEGLRVDDVQALFIEAAETIEFL
jgi:hypothetical protein